MRRKQNLRNILLSMFATFFAVGGLVAMDTTTQKATAEETSSNITWLMTPTDENDYKLDNDHVSGQYTIGIEDNASAPSEKVIHYTFDNSAIPLPSGAWPTFTVNVPCENATEVTDFAGWVMWIEYSGVVSSTQKDSNYAIFNFGNSGHAILNSTYITFVDENGKITMEKPRWELFHCKYTAIPDTDSLYAYEYSFQGYMIMPKENFSGGTTLGATNTFSFTSDSYRTANIDLKIGDIGYYTDYDKVVNELGRCNYSFVDTDGTVVKSESVRPGSVVTAPEYTNSYMKDGKVYTLVGWSGYTDGMTISSDVTFNASYKVSDFHMVKGASIRTNEGSSGIRFTAEFDENLYNEVSLDENKEFGMIITKYDYYQAALETNEDLVKGLESLGSNKYVLITESSKNPLKPYEHIEETTRSYRINGAITNIQYSHADWKWIGVGVVITKTDAGNSYFYCAHDVESSARSAAYVASAALNNPAEDFDDEQVATVKNYVYQTAAKASGVSEAEYKAAADKSVYLKGYSLEINGGLNTSYKFNQNVAGKEAYLEIGKPVDLSAVVTNSLGNVLDVAYTLSVSNEGILKVDGTTVTALKNGYATLTMSCELFGYSETVTVYTGSEDAGNRANSRIGSNANATKAGAVTGEIAGQPYYWYQYQTKNSAHIYTSYADISVYYVDYLLSQGYKYLRIPFYFDTTRYEELGGTAEQVTTPYITTWIAKGFRESTKTDGIGYHKNDIPANEWCYYDMDLMQYRMNFVEATGNGVDTYGMKLKASSYYQYLNMKFCSAYSYVYVGNMTFVKDSVIEIDESNDSVSVGETVNLAERYATKESVKYFVDGVEIDSFVALNSEHKIEIKANLYTAKIGDGKYTIGSTDSWKVSYATHTPVEKTLEVEGAIEAIEDTDLYTIRSGESFDVSTLLPSEYSYELEVFKNYGGVLTEVDVADDMVLRSENLEIGAYFVKAYVIFNNQVANKILYYTLTLNYLGENELGAWIETPTADNYKSIFNSYQYTTVQYLTDTTVTTEVPAGKTGSFLKYAGTANNTKEAMAFSFKPVMSETYYRSLLASARDYWVQFDVWVENVDPACTRTEGLYYSWNANGDSFTTHGQKISLNAWHTFEIPLATLVNNLENGEVKFFGLYIPYGGYSTADRVCMYIGNIRLEGDPMMWSAETLTKEMLTTYQYSSSQNRQFTSITTEIPQGGVAGTYVKWAQTASKEDVQLAVAPIYAKEYYEELVASGKKYKITYDVYVEITTEGCLCTEIQTKLWYTKADGTNTFATKGKLAVAAWHTVEVDLQYLVNKWGNYRLFGLNFLNQKNLDRSKDFVTFYFGNIQLVEGEASGVPALKNM